MPEFPEISRVIYDEDDMLAKHAATLLYALGACNPLSTCRVELGAGRIVAEIQHKYVIYRQTFTAYELQGYIGRAFDYTSVATAMGKCARELNARSLLNGAMQSEIKDKPGTV